MVSGYYIRGNYSNYAERIYMRKIKKRKEFMRNIKKNIKKNIENNFAEI